MNASNTQTNPYVGPQALATGQAIFGRDREILELCDLLIYKRFVLLHSPSGAGKTSLIQAGLVPALIAQGFRVTQPLIRVSNELPQNFSKTGDIFNRYLLSTYISLESAFSDKYKDMRTPLDKLTKLNLKSYMELRQKKLEEIERDKRLEDSKRDEKLEEAEKDRKSDEKLEEIRKEEVLIFDQFEEIISLNHTDQEVKREFFRQLGALLCEYRYLALFAMREEYVASLEDYFKPLPERLGVRFRLDLLGEQAAKEVVQKTAEGVTFTDEAADALVRDLRQSKVQRADGSIEPLAGPYVEPVHLQVVCHQLWEIRDKNKNEIGMAALESLHRAQQSSVVTRSLQATTSSETQSVSTVDLALSAFYAQKVAEVAKAEGDSERAIRDWFDQHLITAQGVRGQVLRAPEKSNGLDNEIIQALVDTYLVRREDRRGLTWFELAHDRLIDPVRHNNQVWRKKMLSAFQRGAELWWWADRRDDLLLRNKALERGKAWAEAHEHELTDVEREFLNTSISRQKDRDKLAAARAETRKQKEKSFRRQRIYSLAVTVFVVLLGFTGINLFQARNSAIEARRIAVLNNAALSFVGLLNNAAQSVDVGDEGRASYYYTQATQLAVTSGIPLSNNEVCWQGSTRGFAHTVMQACETAVEIEPDNGGFRDSRGLARALTGNTQGAIDDFSFYVNWASGQRLPAEIEKRRQWIQELEAGQNPFDSDTLCELQGPHSSCRIR